MPRLNRVDPFGDLHAVSSRGMFTGNRGCLVDENREVVRHHRGDLWIACVTTYKDWKSPLDRPDHWTPIFFLDDAVALAAGHRPCGLCRRHEYISYQEAVRSGLDIEAALSATELNKRLAGERLRRGRGLDRATDRKTWRSAINELPVGTVIVDAGVPRLLTERTMFEFDFEGWRRPRPRPASDDVDVLTPPTSVLALANGFSPALHDTAR